MSRTRVSRRQSRPSAGFWPTIFPEAALDKAARTVEKLIGDPSVSRHVQLLVGAGATEEFSREELFDVWRTLLERIARSAPLLLVLEDLHWADEGFDFVDHLTDWAEAPVLVLALARPELMERRPTWGGASGMPCRSPSNR